MIRQGTLGASTVESTALYRTAGACALVGGVLGLIWLPSTAEAARIPRDARTRLVADHNNDGNGHHNATSLSVRSPVRNRGYQHTTNRNAGGVSDAQNALCHNVRVCNVTQKVTMVVPEKTAAPTAEGTPSGTAPQTRTSPLGAMVYMGPYGLMLIGGGSAGPASAGDASGQPGSFDCPPNFFW
jgi:hypothetical protein